MKNKPPILQAVPLDSAALEAERIASDLSYSHYKDSGAKLRDEIDVAAALEHRWNLGSLS